MNTHKTVTIVRKKRRIDGVYNDDKKIIGESIGVKLSTDSLERIENYNTTASQYNWIFRVRNCSLRF